MGNDILLSSIPLEQLECVLAAIVKREIRAKAEEDIQEKFLSPEETCKLFVPAISVATLNNYANEGLVKKYYLGRLTFYKYSEVVTSLKSIKRYHRKDLH